MSGARRCNDREAHEAAVAAVTAVAIMGFGAKLALDG
jgi:hypothetical protein